MLRSLDSLYRAAGMVSAALILGICLLVSAQILLNAIGRVAPGLLPSTIPSYADFAGFMLAGATFLALAHTLRAGGHIRVRLLVDRLPPRAALIADGAVLTLAAGFVGYALWYCVALVRESVHYGDVSNGMIAIPLWIPQGVMAFGIALLLLALLHSLLELILAKTPLPTSSDEA